MEARRLGPLLSRRDFGRVSALALAGSLAGCGSNDNSSIAAPAAGPQVIRRRNGAAGAKLNIVFLFGDQER